jgi:hypothetical protein
MTDRVLTDTEEMRCPLNSSDISFPTDYTITSEPLRRLYLQQGHCVPQDARFRAPVRTID